MIDEVSEPLYESRLNKPDEDFEVRHEKDSVGGRLVSPNDDGNNLCSVVDSLVEQGSYVPESDISSRLKFVLNRLIK
jgi:hypothetical protein